MALTKVTNSLLATPPTDFDDGGLQDDIALLGFKVASNGSLAKYNLVDQTVDDFQDTSGVDASASTNEARDSSGKYYKGESTVTPTVTSNHDSTGTDGDYTWYKWTTVTASGSYVNNTTQDSTFLVVAGGGSGGSMYTGNNNAAGGGGAGGMLTNFGGTAQSLTASTTYTVVVGAGGAAEAGSSGEIRGNVGADSSIAGSGLTTLTADGGGYGGSSTGGAGGAGGSGGGGMNANVGGTKSQGDIGNGTGYGYDGGASSGGIVRGGGGGGAGGVGVDSPTSGAGGPGLANSITGASVIYAAGGGGGGSSSTQTGGAGGSSGIGGTGGNYETAGTAGDDATGSGGGAGGAAHSASTTPSGKGGDGIVIIRRETSSTSEGANMTLVSTTTAAQAAPTKGDIVLTYTNGAGTTTLDTDLTAEISADGGSTWTALALGSEGSTGAHNIATSHDVTISSTITAPYNMAYRIKTLNQSVSKTTRIQAVSLGWS